MDTGDTFLSIKRPEHQAHDPHPSTFDVKYAQSFTSWLSWRGV